MQNIWTAINGKKTYILTSVGVIVVLLNHFWGPIPGIGLDPAGWLTQLGALGIGGSLRHAIG